MADAMSMNPLSNPKVALGIAAAIVVMALAASTGLSGFVTDTSPEVESPEDSALLAAEMDSKPESKPATPTSWADGGATDDWGASGNEGSLSEAGWGAPDNDGPRGDAPDFGEFNPEPSADDDDFNDASNETRPSPSRGGAGSRTGGRITSGAAPGAPAVRPPGL